MHDVVGMFEPLYSLPIKKGLVGARCVAKIDGSQKWYRIFNPNNASVKITNNQPVAKFCQINESDIKEYNPDEIPMVNVLQVTPNESFIKTANELGVKIDNPDLSKYQKRQLLTLIGQNRDCFAKDMSELSTSNLYQHSVDTGNAKPVRQRFYRVSPKIQEEQDKQIKEFLETGKIEPSLSEWALIIGNKTV
jgi:hypothetical protein